MQLLSTTDAEIATTCGHGRMRAIIHRSSAASSRVPPRHHSSDLSPPGRASATSCCLIAAPSQLARTPSSSSCQQHGCRCASAARRTCGGRSPVIDLRACVGCGRLSARAHPVRQARTLLTHAMRVHWLLGVADGVASPRPWQSPSLPYPRLPASLTRDASRVCSCVPETRWSDEACERAALRGSSGGRASAARVGPCVCA